MEFIVAGVRSCFQGSAEKVITTNDGKQQQQEEGAQQQDQQQGKERCSGGFFQMPLHYPRYTREDYEKMAEWKVDCLLIEYGLPVTGDLAYKREFAMGAFLWPSH